MNPYREHLDRIQTEVKRTSREFMYTSPYDKRLVGNQAYNMNFAAVSGGEPFDSELLHRVNDMMKEATGVPDPEIV